MKKILSLSVVAVALMAACAVVPSGRHGELALIPLLPPLVVLDTEPYYFQGGVHYYYSNDAWYYSKSRSGPWTDLPRGHYPKETRYKGREGGQGWGRDHDNRRR
jgi:hypothetical protein